MVIMITVVASSSIFVYCFFGMVATESYEKMADSLFEFNWTDLDHQLQKYFIIMIGNMQKPIYYHGFYIAILNLNTFSKVSVNEFSFSKQ